MFSAKLKFEGMQKRSYGRRNKFWAQFSSGQNTYYMAAHDFNKLVHQMKDGTLEGSFVLGTGSHYNVIRPYDPSRRQKSVASQHVYFSKNGGQLLRKNSPQRYEGGAVYSIPKKSFEATLKFKCTFHRTYRDYVAFTLNRLTASLMFGIDKELEFHMSNDDFCELVTRAAKTTPQQNIAALNGVWNFKGATGGRTTLVCENLL